MKARKQLARRFEYATFTMAALLICIGLSTVFASAYQSGLGEVKSYFPRQLTWALLGLVAMSVAAIVDYRFMARFSYQLYAVVLAMLVAVDILGQQSHGAQRWFRLFGFTLQPSEFVKVATLFALAHYLDDIREKIREVPYLLGALAIAGVPTVLVILQPDLGTGLVLVVLVFGMVYAANANPRHLATLGALGLAISPIFWMFLKDYQKARLLAFINPTIDPLGTSYQIIQSKIAVGAGGLAGKGWLNGTQSQLNFLPEQHTDFIFSVFAEQWGFLGSLLVAMLYVGLLFQALKIGKEARDFLGGLLAVGIVTIIAFQTLVNLLMTVGFMPVTGIPLPFMSYGGSNLLTMMACVGLLLGIHLRTHIFS
ncbi:MAG: rod shape-determining protein RodA [Candidatus Abyssubacteria bacterium]